MTLQVGGIAYNNSPATTLKFQQAAPQQRFAGLQKDTVQFGKSAASATSQREPFTIMAGMAIAAFTCCCAVPLIAASCLLPSAINPFSWARWGVGLLFGKKAA